MAYIITDTVAGTQQIADNSTTQKHPLGTSVAAKDPTYGAGEFIYLLGVASTTVGSIVEYDTAFASALSTVVVELPRPLAVAMAATVASEWGWYQISGEAVISKSSDTSFAADAIIRASAGFAEAALTAVIIQGAIVAVASTSTAGATTCRVMISRPHGTEKVVEA